MSGECSPLHMGVVNYCRVPLNRKAEVETHESEEQDPMDERMEEAGAFDEPLTVKGRQLHAGDPAPDFRLDYLDLADLVVRTICLADSSGSVRLLNVVNSLASPLCQQVIKRWETLRVWLPAHACIY